LHTFDSNGADGFLPFASLIFDTAGNLYSTTQDGGALGDGTAFDLKPQTGRLEGDRAAQLWQRERRAGFRRSSNL